jgi:ABC-type sugar transport system substrate-binding protein
MRELAFIETLANKIPYEILLFESSVQNPSFAASISRTIAEKLEQSEIGSVVCFDGFTSKMCAALRKIKTNLRKDILGFGFEDDPQNKEYIELGILKAVVAQPFQDQLDYSIELAKNYIEKGAFPKNKYTYFPSVLKEY